MTAAHRAALAEPHAASRRSRRSPTTRSCRTATRRRWSRPDGSIDWLCVPSFDAASVFGTLLDRGAGSFRFGPFGINAPAARSYLPGTNVLTTTWHTTTGWLVVRDALVMGPNHQEDTVTPHTRPPADEDAEHLLVRTVECIEGSVELELVCEPVFDYGRTPAEWSLVGGSRQIADATGAGTTIRLQTDLSVGIEGNRVRARHVMRKGERAYCSLSWAEALASPADVDEADAAILATTTLLARVARPGAPPRPPLARADPALGAGDQGPHLHAHRRDRRGARRPRCRRRRAASATGTTATRGCATRRSRCRRCTGSTSTGRPTSSCSSSPTWSPTPTARCRSCTASTDGAT